MPNSYQYLKRGFVGHMVIGIFSVQVPSILFAPSHLLACYTIATGTALVMDCSYSETMVVPVVEGTPVLWALQSAPVSPCDGLPQSVFFFR